MADFPFPSRELALEEIKNDHMYRKMIRCGIDPQAAMERAWETGEKAAKDFWKEMKGETNFDTIAQKTDCRIRRIGKDNVVAGMRIFAEYGSGNRTMELYTESIKKWALKNGLSLKKAENLILSHEFFHHLEHTRIGLTSRQVELPMFELFGLKIGKTGVRALSEAGAHAFARTYYDLSHSK